MYGSMASPELTLMAYRMRERELLKEAEAARLLKEVCARRPQRRGPFLPPIGGILAGFGLRRNG